MTEPLALPPSIAALQTIAGYIAAAGFALLLIDLGWPRLLDELCDLLNLWRALIQDVIDWADSIMPDSERRR